MSHGIFCRAFSERIYMVLLSRLTGIEFSLLVHLMGLVVSDQVGSSSGIIHIQDGPI